MKKTNKIFGIDSLYYFCESNDDYDDLYLEILDQIEDIKGKYQKKEIEFENKDITIKVNDVPLHFLGKAEGYHWFIDTNEYFKIGFKDKFKNRGLNDIRVQLLGVGIYSIGIKSLIEFINKELLKEYVTGYFPITRVDLNCFIQYDFSFVTKEMFVSKKKKYSTISEIGSSTTTQTLYVGKEPFKLRLYNKKEELKKSKKKDLMYEYFSNHNFDLEDEIFNVEFEIHRTHIKQFGIDSLDDFFKHAVRLFQFSMNDIRLIDINSLSDNAVEHNNKRRAETLPIWDEIQKEFNLKEFLQSSLSLERIKRKVSIYDDTKFEYEFIVLIRKAIINDLNLDRDYLNHLYEKGKDSFKKTTTPKQLKQDYIDIEFVHENGKVEKYRQLPNGEIIKPLRTLTITKLSDYDLHRYLEKVTQVQHLSTRNKHIFEVAYKEAMNRGLIPSISSIESLENEEDKLDF
jgi:hypothetical protein